MHVRVAYSSRIIGINQPVEILIVEDNPGDVGLLRHFLSSLVPIKITVASDGEDALKILKTLRPDLVLLDVNLPRIEGHEVLRSIRSTGSSETVVVMMSSSPRPAVIHDTLNNGANGYILKPNTFEEFQRETEERINNWIATIAQRKKHNGQADAAKQP